MKRITLLLAFIGMITLQGCTKEEVVQVNDNYFVAKTLEYTVSFNAGNDYGALISYPSDVQVLPSDMVLAYRLDRVVNGNDVWKPLPQTYFFNDGTLDFRYDYDFTQLDIDIYLEGFDVPNIPAASRNNQVFRVVIIPSDFANKTAVDFKDYNAVVKAFNIDESKIQKIN